MKIIWKCVVNVLFVIISVLRKIYLSICLNLVRISKCNAPFVNLKELANIWRRSIIVHKCYHTIKKPTKFKNLEFLTTIPINKKLTLSYSAPTVTIFSGAPRNVWTANLPSAASVSKLLIKKWKSVLIANKLILVSKKSIGTLSCSWAS